MTVYAICHQAQPLDRASAGLCEAIKTIGSEWWHHIDGVWLVKADKSADEICDALLPELRETERLLVMEVTDNCQGWLPEKSWQWINNHFPREKTEGSGESA